MLMFRQKCHIGSFLSESGRLTMPLLNNFLRPWAKNFRETVGSSLPRETLKSGIEDASSLWQCRAFSNPERY
jgi:hypothetical protein